MPTATLDRRLLTAGLTVTVAELVAVFVDHWPVHPPISPACPACGHEYTENAPECPTAATVRPLLARRRNEVPRDVVPVEIRRAVERPPAQPTRQSVPVADPVLFGTPVTGDATTPDDMPAGVAR